MTFGARRLRWPWGEDRHGIEQALNEAEWLRKWIERRTGLGVPVCAILTLPGWWVNESPSPALRVVNPKLLPDAVRGRWPATLSPEQVDLIARQIELVCRDVEE